MSYRVLIIGGGFTGLEVARRLAKQADVAVTLIDTEAQALFTPRLVDALAQACSESDVQAPHTIIAARRGYIFVEGRVESIDHEKKRVTVTLSNQTSKVIAYDVLVCAYGADTNYYQLKGKEYTFPLKTWEQLVAIETRLASLSRLTRPIRVAVIGGGATGIEIAFALNKRLEKLGISSNKRTLTVFQASPQILPGFLPKTINTTVELMKAHLIDLKLSVPVSTVTAERIVTQSETLPMDLVIWAAGICPNVTDNTFPTVDQQRGLTVDHTLRLAPHHFAGGDVIQFRDKQQLIPKNAQTALKMGALIAHNVLREKNHQRLASFRYRSVGVMLWLDDTAAFDLLNVSLLSKLIVWIRQFFYTIRWRTMTC